MDKLYEEALKAYHNSYSPYSHFQVGASILLKDGKIISGCNVENASYGLSNCAERTTLFTAYSLGYRKEDIEKILVIGDSERPVSPCGACRQVLVELMDPESEIILTNLKKEYKILKVKDLLPYYFSQEDLHE
ncbi:MAG TPA: cytidine deaminase [Bacilli bacterium]